MSDGTAIEWTDATWTPFLGDPGRDIKQRWYCQRISPGCDHCYASTLARRFGGRPYPTVGEEDGRDHVRLKETALLAPLGWKRPRHVFLSSMTDVAGEWVSSEWLLHVWAVMVLTPQHTYQVLTKRPQRLAQWFQSEQGNAHAVTSALYAHGLPAQCEAAKTGVAGMVPWPLPNVWVGTSIELDRYAWRAKVLAEIPAAVRFVSAEPLLGPLPSLDLERIDWLIVGGESGPGARPMHPTWARDLRDRSQAAGVAFFFKQWGEWAPSYFGEGSAPREGMGFHYFGMPDPLKVWRFGKKAAGRLLDGDTWNEIPAAARREVARC